MATCVPLAASTAAGILVNVGAITMSQSVAPATSGLNAEKNARVSACVLNIFQLPAITRRRLGWLICRRGPPRPEVCGRQGIRAERRHPSKCAKFCQPGLIGESLQPNHLHPRSK